MSIKVTIHSVGVGTDLLTGKDSKDGLTVSFEDGTVKESFLSWVSFRQLLALKKTQAKPEAKPDVKLPVAMPANGPAVTIPK